LSAWAIQWIPGKPFAIILDDEDERLRPNLDVHVDQAGCGMLVNVAQRLLDDAKDGHFHRRRQAHSQVIEMSLHLQPRSSLKAFQIVFQAGDQAQLAQKQRGLQLYYQVLHRFQAGTKFSLEQVETFVGQGRVVIQ